MAEVSRVYFSVKLKNPPASSISSGSVAVPRSAVLERWMGVTVAMAEGETLGYPLFVKPVFRIVPSVAFNAVHRAGIVEPIARLGNAHHHRLIPALSHVPARQGSQISK